MGTEAESLKSQLGLDTTDFKTGLATANRELRVLESGFRASISTLGNWAGSISGLELRQKSLTSQLDLQKAKVAALRSEYERQVAANGEMSIAAQKAEIDLNKETERLGKMQTELKGTEQDLQYMKYGNEDAGKSAQEMGEKVEKSGKKVETFKTILHGVGAAAKVAVAGILAVGAGAIAAIGMMAGLALNTAATADNLDEMSIKTGISITRLQEMGYASKLLGTDLETVIGANAKLIRSMAAAEKGTGAQAKAFRELGVKVKDAHGNLRDSQVVMGEVFDALGKIQNPAERDALAMTLFGKSAQELNPLIAAGAAGMADLTDQAHKMGAVMSEEDVKAAAEVNDQLEGLKLGFQGVVSQIGMAFMPMLSGLAGTAQGYLQQLVGIVQGSGGDIGKMATGIGGLLGQIVTDLAAQLPQLATVGLGILTSILTAIIGALPTLITAAIGIVSSLVGFLVQNLPMLITAAVGILTSLVGILVQNLPMIMQAGIKLLLTLVTAIIGALPSLIGAAFQMIITLVQGIAAALPTLIPAIVSMLVLIIQTIIENLPMLLQAALQLILGLVQGLAAALPILIAAVPTILIAIVNALTTMLPMLVKMAPEIIVALITGIIGALPTLGEAVVQIITTIVSVLQEGGLVQQLLQAGVDILKGIWNGIAAQLPWFWAKIKEFALGIWTAIKNALHIKSPSSLFAETVGANIPAGIWAGIEGGMPKLQSQLAAAMRGLTASYDVAVNGRMAIGAAAGTGTVNNNNSNRIYNITNAGIDAAELERIQRQKELLYGN